MNREIYSKGMEVGTMIEKNNLFEYIPENWSDSVEIAEIVKIIEEVTIKNILKAIKIIKEKIIWDSGWTDEARGLIAGYYFGEPNGKNLMLAQKAEQVWDNDIEGKYGYYHEVCSDVKKERV